LATTIETADRPVERRRSRVLRSVARRLEQLAARVDDGQAERQSRVRKQAFWPYSPEAAIASVLMLWVVLGGLAYLFNRYAGWPSGSSQNHVLYVATVVGLLPVALLILDAVARSGGAVDLRGFKIDFSRSVVGSELQLAPNLGQAGPVVSDTAAGNIIEALRTSAEHDALRIDLDATWWLTRLLALSAGATRAGAPRAFVFVRAGADGRQAFVGWTRPKAVLDALLEQHPTEFREPYAHAQAITHQLAAFSPVAARPPVPWTPLVARYLNDQRYNTLGLAALEHVLLDQLAPFETAGTPLELNFADLRSQLGDALVTDEIDLTEPAADQIGTLLQSSASFIALVRRGEYRALVRRDDAERDILRQLAQPQELAA
jgi:hypothetical protein